MDELNWPEEWLKRWSSKGTERLRDAWLEEWLSDREFLYNAQRGHIANSQAVWNRASIEDQFEIGPVQIDDNDTFADKPLTQWFGVYGYKKGFDPKPWDLNL